MTDAERLKVAEEIIEAHGWRGYHVGDLWLTHHESSDGWTVYRANKSISDHSQSEITSHKNPIDCIILARQKLAAEREAVRTPEVRRLRAALEDVARQTIWSEATRIARKALEDS